MMSGCTCATARRLTAPTFPAGGWMEERKEERRASGRMPTHTGGELSGVRQASSRMQLAGAERGTCPAARVRQAIIPWARIEPACKLSSHIQLSSIHARRQNKIHDKKLHAFQVTPTSLHQTRVSRMEQQIYPSRTTSSTASVKIWQPFAISSFEMFSGGMKRTTS